MTIAWRHMKHVASLLAGSLLAACSAGACGCPAECAPKGCQTLGINPSSFTFALDDNAPEPVTVTHSPGPFTSLTLSVADPTVVGVTPPVLAGSSATFSLIPIAHGSTTVSATDQTGLSAPVSVSTATCGRPASLLAAQQVVPASGATGVQPSLGTVYLIAYYHTSAGPVAVTGNLHVIVGAHGTLEGGPLLAATLPPGTMVPTPLPLPEATGIVVSAALPALAAGQSYQTQPYNDTCQPAVLAGSFST